MIQRIQSIYLFLAAVAAIAFLFVPFGKLNMNGATVVIQASLVIYFDILCGLITTVSIISIFLFKNRILQMKVITLAILLSVALIGLTIYEIVTRQTNQYQFGPAVIIPLFVLIFNFLAYKGVKHDEQLVKSMDRLR